MYIHVKVVAGAKKDSVEELAPLRYKVFVRAPRERGLANERMREVLAHYGGITPKEVVIVSGHHTPSKLVSIPDTGLSPRVQ